MDKSFIELNGNFVVCSKHEEQGTTSTVKGIILTNKVEEGFQKLNKFKIEWLNFKNEVDFPFKEGDIIVSASSGTIVNHKGNKVWLFQPEHILARIEK